MVIKYKVLVQLYIDNDFVLTLDGVDGTEVQPWKEDLMRG